MYVLLIRIPILFNPQIDLNTLFLRESGGPRAFFPDSANRSFRFTSDVGTSVLSFNVEGTSAERNSISESVALATPSISQSSGPSGYVSPYPSHQPSRPIFSAKKITSDSSFTLKIIQARVIYGSNSKLSFVNSGQMFTSISESTATVPYLSTVIQDKWGEGYVLVTSDGLKVEDSDGTRGIFSLCLLIGQHICFETLAKARPQQ